MVIIVTKNEKFIIYGCGNPIYRRADKGGFIEKNCASAFRDFIQHCDKFIAKLDQTVATGGIIYNMKFNPDLLAKEENLWKCAKLIKAYFLKGGGQVQIYGSEDGENWELLAEG